MSTTSATSAPAIDDAAAAAAILEATAAIRAAALELRRGWCAPHPRAALRAHRIGDAARAAAALAAALEPLERLAWGLAHASADRAQYGLALAAVAGADGRPETVSGRLAALAAAAAAALPGSVRAEE